MKNFVCIIMVLIPVLVLGQLREFEITRVNVEGLGSAPESDVGFVPMIIVSTLDNLSFVSSTGGIEAVSHQRVENRYLISLLPKLQKITVRAEGYREQDIWGPSLPVSYETLVFSIEPCQEDRGFGDLMLESNPPGAEISIAQIPSFSGTTPYMLSQFFAGPYTVILKKAGYDVFVTNIRIQAGRSSEVRFSLDPLPGTFSPNNETIITSTKDLETHIEPEPEPPPVIELFELQFENREEDYVYTIRNRLTGEISTLPDSLQLPELASGNYSLQIRQNSKKILDRSFAISDTILTLNLNEEISKFNQELSKQHKLLQYISIGAGGVMAGLAGYNSYIAAMNKKHYNEAVTSADAAFYKKKTKDSFLNAGIFIGLDLVSGVAWYINHRMDKKYQKIAESYLN
ncbi:MAG: PEGA domain-containing protein [Candidatus Cloacimonadaceae bacterium]|nr:PEGA domain-containing protein [Candidatus Cloacimonadota bacterium]MDX9949566.1 PEGA domain-containing protein [Candidatus Syntrophosphaera sp.]